MTTGSINLYYTGDYVSGIFDNAGKIRQYLRDAYEVGTTWVLLGGDNTIVPGRLGWGTDYNSPGISDLYYADRTGDWNVDGDTKYGEETDDNIDYAPELFVGRILCNTIDEVESWTNKLLKYEQYPGNGDYSYLTRTFCQESDEPQSYNAGNSISQALPPNFNPTNIQSELPSFDAASPYAPYADNIINEINSTKYGFWFWEGHGNSQSSSTLTNNINGGTLSSLNTTNINNLTNSVYPTIVLSSSCSNAMYTNNIAEKYTVGIQNGGPAFLGNTMIGMTGGYHLTCEFIELLIDYTGEVIRPSITNIGMTDYIAKYNYNMHLLSISHNLFGCPEMPIWTDEPIEFSNVQVLDLGSSIFVNVGVNSTICLSSIDNGNTFHQVVHDQTSYSFSTTVRPLYVTVTKKHYLPYTSLTGGNLSNTVILSGKMEMLEGLNGSNKGKIIVKPNTKLIFPNDKSITTSDEVVIKANDIKDIYNIEKTFLPTNKKDMLENANTNYFIGNNPNPFNPSTNLQYSLVEASKVTIKIFNLTGQLVKEFKIENQTIGKHSIFGDGKNYTNHLVSSGVYFIYFNTVSINSGKNITQASKMLFVK